MFGTGPGETKLQPPTNSLACRSWTKSASRCSTGRLPLSDSHVPSTSLSSLSISFCPRKTASQRRSAHHSPSSAAANRAESNNFPRTSISPNLSWRACPSWVKYGERSRPYSIIFSLGRLIALRTSERSEVVAIWEFNRVSSSLHFYQHRPEHSRLFPLTWPLVQHLRLHQLETPSSQKSLASFRSSSQRYRNLWLFCPKLDWI